MTATLLLVFLLIAGALVVFVLDFHGKARAYEHGEIDPTADRPPESLTHVELPPPHFNEIDPDRRRREAL